MREARAYARTNDATSRLHKVLLGLARVTGSKESLQQRRQVSAHCARPRANDYVRLQARTELQENRLERVEYTLVGAYTVLVR